MSKPAPPINDIVIFTKMGTIFTRLGYSDHYPERNSQRKIYFDKQRQIIFVRATVFYVDGANYAIKCKIYPNMHTKCSFAVFGLSWTNLWYKDFNYEWKE